MTPAIQFQGGPSKEDVMFHFSEKTKSVNFPVNGTEQPLIVRAIYRDPSLGDATLNYFNEGVRDKDGLLVTMADDVVYIYGEVADSEDADGNWTVAYVAYSFVTGLGLWSPVTFSEAHDSDILLDVAWGEMIQI